MMELGVSDKIRVFIEIQWLNVAKGLKRIAKSKDKLSVAESVEYKQKIKDKIESLKRFSEKMYPRVDPEKSRYDGTKPDPLEV